MNFLKSIISFVNFAIEKTGLKFGIGTKFTVIIISVTLLSMLPALVVSQQILSKNFENTISARLISDAYHKINILDRFFSERLSDLEIITSENNIIFRGSAHSIDERVAYLKDFTNKRKVFASFSIYDMQGFKIGDTVGLEFGADESKKQFFKQSISGGIYFGNSPTILKGFENNPILQISVPIKNEENKIEGVLLANIILKEVENVLLWPFLEDSRYMEFSLVNQDGILVATSHKEQEPMRNDVKDWEVFKFFKISNKSQFVKTVNYEGEERLFIGIKSKEIFNQPGWNWFLFSSIPTKEIFAPIRNAEIGIVIIAIGFLLLVIPFSIFIAETLTKPLYVLARTAEKISEGDFEQKIDIESKDEIGALAKIFYKMMLKLKLLYSSLEDKNKELFKAVGILEEKKRDLEKVKQEVLEALGSVEKQKELYQRQLVETLKFKQVVDFSSDAIFITDSNACIIYANSTWERLNDYDLEEVLGKNPKIMKSGKTPKDLYERMWNMISKGEVFFTEDLINRRKNGEEYEAQLTVYPIKEGDQIIFFVGAEQDITERKIVERSKTEFVSIASHQLRTPLTTINLFTEMLQKGDVGELNKKQSEYLYQIRNSIKRMIGLVNDLLNVSRIETGRLMINPKPAYLEDLIKNVIDECKFLTMGKVCKLEFKHTKSKLPAVMIDENLLHQALHNLVVNAIAYSSPEKKCAVTVKLSRRLSENDYLISVKDEGIGIPDGAKMKLFNKFFRADNAIKMTSNGTGLGLYLVKMVMAESGGKVWFESEENKGSIFYISIPFEGMREKAGEKTLEIV